MIVISSPPPPPSPPAGEPWKPALQRLPMPPRLQIEWEAPDGQRWEVTHSRAAVWLLEGATGLGMVPVDHLRAEGLSHGATWEGFRVPSVEVQLPLRIEAADLDSFLSLRDRVMDALHPAVTSRLIVTRPDGVERSLTLRYQEGATNPAEAGDVLLRRRVTYAVTWLADDPFWAGEPVARRFAYDDSGYRSPPSPPVYLAPSQVLGDAEITNPGEMPAPLSWKVEAPFTGFTIGVGSALTSATLTKATGFLVGDMTAGRVTLVDESGVDRWAALTDVRFAEVPRGTHPLATSVTGAGPGSAVTVTLHPRFLRSW